MNHPGLAWLVVVLQNAGDNLKEPSDPLLSTNASNYRPACGLGTMS